jgi:endonuclease/exonuclease/phosphatase family metal-dependent hydrolase
MLRILTLNIWHGHIPRNAWTVQSIEPAGHKERRFAALVAGIRDLDPDVLLLQECLPQPGLSRELAARLGYDVTTKICNSGLRIFGVGLPAGVGSGEGLSILAKPHLRMRGRSVRRLSGIGFTGNLAALQLGQLRFALAATVHVAERRLVVINTHLRYAYPAMDRFQEAWDALRRRGLAEGPPSKTIVSLVRRNIRVRDEELARLGAWADSWIRRQIPVVIGADLNLDHDAPQVVRLAGKLGLSNVLPLVGARVCTWDPEGNPNIAYSTAPEHPDGTPKPLTHRLVAEYDSLAQCPDHLLLGPSFSRESLRGGGLALDRPYEGVYPSDHYGVYADVEL